MKPIKTTLALAALAGLLAIPAARTLFAAEKPAETSAQASDAANNTLSAEEKAAGFKLLFDGKDTEGWHTYKKDKAGAGWEVKDGVLSCVKPGAAAGDLCSNDEFKWFELKLDYNISKGGNSGILYHVHNTAGATWSTGPEIQLLDNVDGHDGPTKEGRQLAGWLYGLYKPEIDPKTNQPLDATKPAGEWNSLRVLLSPEKCEHDINGVKLVEYVLGSEDMKARIQKSKFGKMKDFLKYDTGYIALQGDHGQVSFRNIRIRPIESK